MTEYKTDVTDEYLFRVAYLIVTKPAVINHSLIKEAKFTTLEEWDLAVHNLSMEWNMIVARMIGNCAHDGSGAAIDPRACTCDNAIIKRNKFTGDLLRALMTVKNVTARGDRVVANCFDITPLAMLKSLYVHFSICVNRHIVKKE
jgi:hypothetical protein